MKVSFFGATQQVTGSNFLVEAGHQRFLVDCGLFQGLNVWSKNDQDFPFDPASIDAVLLTHAHADHSGRLPKLVKAGFKGTIYSTSATYELTELVLEDSASLMVEQAERESRPPIYGEAEVAATLKLFRPVEYGHRLTIGQLKITFHDAGHILGSSFIVLENRNRQLVFSGDLGNTSTTLMPLVDQLQGADYVVCEATYGHRRHEPAGQREQILRETITTTATHGGVLMIPAFAIERTQEILFEIHYLIDSGQIKRLPVFVDSPLAIKVTRVFEKYRRLMNAQDHQEFGATHALFRFRNLTLASSVDESKAINDVPGPKIIIAGSGMMEGGRILHHLKRYLPDSHSTLLIVGFQVEGTLGRRLHEGAKLVQIHGRSVPVKARVQSIGAYSAHADQPQLLDWLKRMTKPKPKKIFAVHCEPDRGRAFVAAVKRELGIDGSMPDKGEAISI